MSGVSTLIGPGVLFSAAELWCHQRVSPELRLALADAGITSTRHLGKRLQQLQGHALRGLMLHRVGVDKAGASWTVSVARDSQPLA